MSAPTKATGGEGKPAQDAPGRKTRGSAAGREVTFLPETAKSVTSRPSESAPRSTRSTAVPLNERAEAIRKRTPTRSREASPEPPRYSNRSARPRIVAAARKTAARHGYERLRLKHITDEAQISHQAFYGHFANKRHAVAAATSDELGAIADLAMRGSGRDEEWAERMLADIDRTLAATYPSTDGPEKWLRERICEAISTEGGFSALRILELIRVSRLGHGEFYRRYGGKRGCLQRIYSDALAEIKAEVGEDGSIASLGAAIASDPERARLLILGASYLPSCDEGGADTATKDSLLQLAAAVVATQLHSTPDGHNVRVVSGSIVEVIRSAVLSGAVSRLLSELAIFELIADQPRSEPPGLRVAA